MPVKDASQNKPKVGLKAASSSGLQMSARRQNKPKVGLKEVVEQTLRIPEGCQNKPKVGLKGEKPGNSI